MGWQLKIPQRKILVFLTAAGSRFLKLEVIGKKAWIKATGCLIFCRTRDAFIVL